MAEGFVRISNLFSRSIGVFSHLGCSQGQTHHPVQSGTHKALDASIFPANVPSLLTEPVVTKSAPLVFLSSVCVAIDHNKALYSLLPRIRDILVGFKK